MSKHFVVFIPKMFPGINDILLVRGRHARNGWNDLKRACHAAVKDALDAQHKVPDALEPGRYRVEIVWKEYNTRRDPDNISGGGTKVILDALVEHGIIPGDGWSCIAQINNFFAVAADEQNVGALVCLYKTDEGHGKPLGWISPQRLRIYTRKKRKSTKRRKST